MSCTFPGTATEDGRTMGRQRLVPAQVLVAGAVVIDDERLVVGLTLSR